MTVVDPFDTYEQGRLADFTAAARTALRFLTLSTVERARVVDALGQLETGLDTGDDTRLSPARAAALRAEIEDTIEAHVGRAAEHPDRPDHPGGHVA